MPRREMLAGRRTMTEAEARALAGAAERGETLELKWETQYEYCWGSVRLDPARGFVGKFTELPHAVLSPWRDRENDWNEAGLISFLRGLPADAAPGLAGAQAAAAAASNIPVGKPHRASCDLDMHVRDYDAMSVQIRVLGKGSIFQPWAPLDPSPRGEVPITLGEGATQFDWGVRSFEGHFLRREDFLHRCEMVTDRPTRSR